MKKRKLRVLSAFDGIGTARQVLKNINREVEYYAYEINKSSIKISKANHPDIIYLGDIRDFKLSDFGKGFFDLIVGGSPCQNFSFSGKKYGMVTVKGVEVLTLERYLELKSEGFEFKGESYLFWEFVNLVKKLEPKYFLLENVKMTKKWANLISEVLGVKPIFVNSSEFTPANRERNYWTNLTDIAPSGESPTLSNLIGNAVTGVGFRGKYIGNRHPDGSKWYQTYRSDRKDGIANAILTSLGGFSKNGKWSGTGHYLTVDGIVKTFTPEHCEQFQGLPIGYTNVKGVSKNQRIHGLGNGWTVPVIEYFFSFID